MMRAGTIFSGIGAPECSSPDIDWRWAAEIDPFAAAVHAARFPNVTNLGDITTVDWHAVKPVDLVVGGPPCQDYSVAGQRASLAGARGDLTLRYAHILDAIDPAWSVTENVPGWLSTPDNAFGTFLGILAGSDAPLVPARGQRWTDAGVVAGPKRTIAWAIKDAQHFGVPQRRRRVFVVACRGAGNFACAAALFPVGEGLRRDTAQGREAGQDTAGGAGDGVAYSLDCQNLGYGGNVGWRNASEPSITLNTTGNTGTANPLGAKTGGGWRGDLDSLCADGFDASEDGTGRGTPLIAVDWQNSAGGPNSENTFMTLGQRHPAVMTLAIRAKGGTGHGDFESETFVAVPLLEVGKRTNGDGYRDDDGIGHDGDPMYSLQAGAQHGVMTLAIRGRGDSHDLEYRDDGIANAVLTPNGGRAGIGVGAVAFHQNVRSEVRVTDVMGALSTGGGKPGQGYPAIAFDPTARQPEWSIDRPLKTDGPLAVQSAMSVRRLTPRECARLQGFPDDWCAIEYRGKPAADGPMYRAYGNSMAVPVIGWVLSRVQQIAAASLEEAPSTGSGRAAA